MLGAGGLAFESLLSTYTVQERWKFQDAGPYTQTPGTIPDTFGNSDDSSDNTFNFNRTGLTFSYQNAPIANTGTTGSFAMDHRDGSLGVARVDLGEISAAYDCNGGANPWTFFVFMKVVVTGTLTGNSGGIGPRPAEVVVGLEYDFDTGNYNWINGTVDTGVPFANGNTTMIAWVGESTDTRGYVFNGAQVSTRLSTSDGRLGAGTSGSETNLACAYKNGMSATNYAKTWYQDAIILSEALSQAQLQELYDASQA